MRRFMPRPAAGRWPLAAPGPAVLGSITMLKVNEYFDGKVKSIGFEEGTGKATVGVMAAGDYEFGTAGPELMKVVSGSMSVLLPGSSEWKDFRTGEEFRVNGNSRFQLRIAADAAYLCRYL